MITVVVNVKGYQPYTIWYSNNQPSDSQYVYIGNWHWLIPLQTKWGNPAAKLLKGKDRYDMKKIMEAIQWYKENHLPKVLDQVHELKGKILGCWCKPLPCHGDVLAELADKT